MEQELKDYMSNVDEVIALLKKKVERLEGEKEEATARADRYERALKLIEQMSDPGDYWKAICDMKSIATKALTPKTSSDEQSTK
jgi:hypothetical protein